MKARPLYGLFLGATVLAAPDARAIELGELVTFTMFEGAADRICARVAQFYTGPDGEQWAWLVPVALPGALGRVPMSRVQAGCAR